MRKSTKHEAPAVTNSIEAGVVKLTHNPLKPRETAFFVRAGGFTGLGNLGPDDLMALAGDLARLVKSPGFVQWAKQCGSTSSAAARRAAGAKKAWETKRKKMAAEAKGTATKQKVTIPKAKRGTTSARSAGTKSKSASVTRQTPASGSTTETPKRVVIVRSKLNPPAPKSAKLPLTGTSAL